MFGCCNPSFERCRGVTGLANAYDGRIDDPQLTTIFTPVQVVDPDFGSLWRYPRAYLILDSQYTDIVALRLWQSPGAQNALTVDGCREKGGSSCTPVFYGLSVATNASGYTEMALPNAGRAMGSVSPC